jgi:aspartyl-tRNA(Asn)/glutamyl-tRNA(Gln) amidotransferase subunit C
MLGGVRDGVRDEVSAVVNLERNGRAVPDSLTGVSDESPRITADDVSKVATLARLILTAELSAMLDHFADIDALDLDDVEPMMQPTPLANVMRDDVVGVTLDRDEVLGQAPLAEDGRFRVPPIVGIEE